MLLYSLLLCLLTLITFFHSLLSSSFLFFFFNDTATTEIYTLSLHDALPIYHALAAQSPHVRMAGGEAAHNFHMARSEEHTTELQSRLHLVCRLLLEKKK